MVLTGRELNKMLEGREEYSCQCREYGMDGTKQCSDPGDYVVFHTGFTTIAISRPCNNHSENYGAPFQRIEI